MSKNKGFSNTSAERYSLALYELSNESNLLDVVEQHSLAIINLINSCTGYKSGNLIGSKSKSGIENLAVFSSITHLGSNPAVLGYVLRPTTIPRNTYKNIKETKVFTVNHITENIIEDAHHTSAKYHEGISEFDKTNNTPNTNVIAEDVINEESISLNINCEKIGIAINIPRIICSTPMMKKTVL